MKGRWKLCDGEEIGGAGVGGIAGEHSAEHAARGGPLTEAEKGLGFEEEGGRALTGGEIVGKAQHRRQRRGEIVDRRGRDGELPGVGEERAEEFGGPGKKMESGSGVWGQVQFFAERGIRGARPRRHLSADFMQVAEPQRRAEPAVGRGRARL